MPSEVDKEDLREFTLKETGADLIGFANIERFADCPPDFHPRNLNRHTRTVIVMGMRILRGTLRPLEQTGRIESRFELPFREKGKGPEPMHIYTEKASEAVVLRSTKKRNRQSPRYDL